MYYMVTLTQKSQVTIPKNIRTVLGVHPGDEVEFVLHQKKVVVHKKPKKLPLEKWRGHLGKFSSDTAMEELR
ncbi:AbrB family transcriptional regulator [Candidatus Woesearchaeota archaeon]|nr:AbrB family transcriptional regulator [Candidatus Woesearchaeota archaeon]|tara:strand:- start:1226 stop:1441 length:216 start_codon:yes stop_codon:yes gene_type:complete